MSSEISSQEIRRPEKRQSIKNTTNSKSKKKKQSGFIEFACEEESDSNLPTDSDESVCDEASEGDLMFIDDTDFDENDDFNYNVATMEMNRNDFDMM